MIPHTAGEPMWTSRETFEKALDFEEERTEDAAFFDSAGMCSTPPSTRDHVFGLFCGEHALPCPRWGDYNSMRAGANGSIGFRYQNYTSFINVPAGINPRSVGLVLVDKVGTEWRWRSFAFGMPAGIIPMHWFLPSQLPELRALIREYFPELN